MKTECTDVETAVSYLRRLAQARMEILAAEERRRATGGSVGDLIADLPQILAAGGERSTASHTRIAEPDVSIVELHWPDGREALVAAETLANLSSLGAAELTDGRNRLRDFERELSELRRRLHPVIGALEHEIATRAAGAVR